MNDMQSTHRRRLSRQDQSSCVRRPTGDTARIRRAPAIRAGLHVVLAGRDDWVPLRRMLELYQHDLSDVWDQDLNDVGEYGYELVEYLDQRSRKAFVVSVDGYYAGFALVDKSVLFREDDWWMAQFFVLRKYRGQGVGRAAACTVLDTFRGRWEIGQMSMNRPAQCCWRSVVALYSAGRYGEHWYPGPGWSGLLQRFDNSQQVRATRHSRRN